ncbi:MAG: class I SAM-dependent methyltransferase [Elusimicrobiota bacterium]|jgi:cephalosporin hydroxylase|nr:class I SAM-dependent methyltransferase [Elusimicrobiota bacterium]
MPKWKVILNALKSIITGQKRISKKKVINFLNFIIFPLPDTKRMRNNQPFSVAEMRDRDKELLSLPIYKTFMRHLGKVSDKWEQYLQIYDRILSPFIIRNEPLSIMEMGVCNGGFLEVLIDFMPKGSKIIGIDINEKCGNLKFDNPNIEIVIGDNAEREFLDSNFSASNFDIIIDDASHICSNTIISFEYLFEKLNFGGLYIVEDAHTSYWKNAGGGLKRKGSTIEYFKQIIDAIHLYYMHPNQLNGKQKKMFEKYNPQIASISFYDSIIVIEKYIKPKTAPFRRYITGSDASILQDNSDSAVKIDKNSSFERFLL